MAADTQLFVGTSGWIYKDWAGHFYPKGMKDADKLSYFSSQFSTVEINSTFYHPPRGTSVKRWYELAPSDFTFAIKLNRYLTHTKRLLPDEDFSQALNDFYALLKHLKEKLGIILVQLPPSMQVNYDRIINLANLTQQAEETYGIAFPLAIEFRHKSWFMPDTFKLLHNFNIAHVINDSPGRWPASTDVVGKVAYIRFHGNKRLYRSSYSDEELEQWAKFIKNECARCEKVFIYFNNDHDAVAVGNARTLIKKLRKPKL